MAVFHSSQFVIQRSTFDIWFRLGRARNCRSAPLAVKGVEPRGIRGDYGSGAASTAGPAASVVAMNFAM